MEQKYKNILLQGWMFDPLELMEKEEQDEYKLALIDSALTGKVQTDNPKWEYLIEKALSSIQETRTKYYEKSQKNGMKGKEYGIQGKEFGKLGGRPRKGETKEQYMERKSLENESLISEKMGEDSQWTKMFNEIKENKELITQINSQTVPDEIFYDFVERYGQETVLSVFRWIMEKYNKN